jgi:CxxC motif-containing protein (DUF1111 family)
MKLPRPVWYLLAAVLALLPVGLRVLTWQTSQAQPVDPVMARAGETLFKHEWTPGDPLAANGDGLGPVYNAASCVACHRQGGPGGGGGLEHNVTTFSVRDSKTTRQGVVHARAVRYQETLRQVHAQLPDMVRPALQFLVPLAGRESEALRFPDGVHFSQRNTPALFGANLIDALPDRILLSQEKKERLRWGLASNTDDKLPVGRAARLGDGRVGKFGWKAQTAGLSDFVRAACANELGLGNASQNQPAPLGKPDYQAPGLDLTLEQCDQLTAFVASLPRPVERPTPEAAAQGSAAGKQLFQTIGCADCHTPDLGPIEGLYSDLLLHRMGQELQGGGSSYGGPSFIPVQGFDSEDGPATSEWRTPPLWGVADSAPYLHDGRATTLQEAIRLHGGQAAKSAERFARLSPPSQTALVGFLKSLRAP